MKKRVISFALWGEFRLYCIGAIKNALLAKKIFPGWICRYYYDVTVPKIIIDYLKNLDNTELIYQMTEYYTPEFQRGMKWNDSTFNIDWPLEMTVISKRDASFSKFEYTTNKKDYFYLE